MTIVSEIVQLTLANIRFFLPGQIQPETANSMQAGMEGP